MLSQRFADAAFDTAGEQDRVAVAAVVDAAFTYAR